MNKNHIKIVSPGEWMNTFPDISLHDYISQIDNYFALPFSKQIDLRSYADKLGKNATIITDIQDGEIVGFAAAYLNKEHESYLSCLCISPDYRGQGRAARILGYVKSMVLQLHSPKITCRTNANDPIALKMYEKAGFTPSEETISVKGHEKVILTWHNPETHP